jgi:PKD repeat protein
VYDAFSTGWRILILLKGVAIIPPDAVICDCDEQEYNYDQDINLDASCSYHPDITRSIVSYAWDLDNDGEFDDAVGETATIAGGYSETGYYPVSVKVTDDNPANLGGPQTSIYTCQVYVHPPPHCPHAFAGGPYDGWVNTPLTLDASASWDPDNEIVLYEWDLDNDGLYGTEDDDCFGEIDDAVGINPAWTWDAPYTGVVGLRVTDAEGEFEVCSDEDFTTVDIGNHTPVCDPNGPYQAGPGTTVSLDGSGSHDIDPGDQITCAWDLDTDGEFDDADGCEAEMAVSSDAEYGTVYDICLRVTDSYGEYDITCTTVTVVPNQSPVADANGPYTGDEGSPISLDGTGSSDPDVDPLTYSWSVDDTSVCTFDDATAPTPELTCTDNGSFTVTLVVDDGQVTDSGTASVTVNNVAPIVSIDNVIPTLVAVDESITADGSFTDPGTSDTHTAEWDWGDTHSDGTVSGPNVGPDSHTYSAAGIYAIQLTVTDDDGDVGNATYLYVVVYDPSGGFVTGGGWIDSPAGAYMPDPSLTGKANFGFVSKYKKGADTPTGNTEFQFHAADLNFHSESYEWLVVTGGNYARFKGSGTINGMGDYKFMLWAGDDEPDTFRIRIWEEDEITAVETDVYDNGMDQEIGGGSIVVHTKK